MEILHTLLDALLNSILITGLVVIMMMMIECFNIESHGRLFSALGRSRLGQILTGALLGVIPGCMGGFAAVSLYTHRMISFGALTAMMIASSGDEAFVMLAMFPDKAWWIMLLIFGTGIVAGLATDMIHGPRHGAVAEAPGCTGGYEVGCCGEGDAHEHQSHTHKKRHYRFKRITMFLGVALFIAALAGGLLEHEHEETHEAVSGGINLLSEEWMNIFFAALSVILLFVLVFASDHFIEHHLWEHIIKKHLATVFCWTLGVLAVLGVALQYIDITAWISSHSGITALMIVIATIVGIIPESGPHLVFVSIFALYLSSPELDWTQFLPVLLASSISQDGHASIPLLAEDRRGFFKAKAINCFVALVCGFACWGIVTLF